MTDKRWMIAIAALVVLLLIPFAATPVPPLLDYPDHVAEMYVLAHMKTDPVLSRVYAIHWTVVANAGVEMIMPVLLRWLPLWATGRGFLVLSLLLPLAGAGLFSRAAFGRWSAWPLAGGLVAYNSLFLLGFMNFLIGLGLALCAAAGWVAWRGTAPVRTILAAIIAAVVLFFVHLFALLFFALLVGAHELVSLTGPTGRRWPGVAAIVSRLVPDSLPFVLPILLLLGSTLAQTEGPTMHQSLKVKVGELFYPFLTYYQTPERVLALVFLVAMAALVSRGWARVSWQAVIALLVLLAVWPFIPNVYRQTGYIDTRFPVMMGYLLFAGFLPDRLPRPVARVTAAAIFIVMAVRIGLVTNVWAGHNADLAELHEVLTAIEPGSQVLAVDVPTAQLVPYWLTHRRNWMNAAYIKTYYHDAAMVITDRDAFWPRLFTGLGKQPLVVNPAYQDRTAPEGELPDYHELALDQPSAAALVDAPYLRDWPKKFDYVLLLAAGAAGDLAILPPERLELVRKNEFAALFRVRRNGVVSVGGRTQ